MRKTTLAIGLIAAMLVIAGASFGGLASAASTHKASVARANPSGTAPPTIGSYMADLQKLVPDPTATTPAHIRAVAKKLAKTDGFSANLTITIKCSYPPLNCQVIVSW